jgi:hypothetical protein
MKIMVCGSMSFAQQMVDAKQALEQHGHVVELSHFVQNHLEKTMAESEAQVRVEKMEQDAMRTDFEKIRGVDAVVVLNYHKRGVDHYIGGNTLLEMGLAHILDKKIFLLHPVPNIEYYQSEIEAMRPVVLHGDVTKVV